MPSVNVNNEFVFDFSSSFDSNTSFWSLSPASMDDFSTSLPAEMPMWSNPTMVPSALEFVPSFTVPVPGSNTQSEMQYFKAHSLDEEPMATFSAPMSVQSTSPPEKSSRSCLCDTCGKTFTRVADVRRHQQSVHFPVLEDCPMPRCPRKGKNGLSRKDHLIEHMRSYHHIDIPKRAVGKRKSVKGDVSSFPAPYSYAL